MRVVPTKVQLGGQGRTVEMATPQRIGQLSFCIVEKATLRPLGICGTKPFDALGRRAEAGMILKSEARERGFSREGLAALVTMAFSVFPIDEVWVQYSQGHLAAERLVISLGFSPDSDPSPGTESPVRRIWSVHRPSWCSRHTAINPGEENVERDRFS